MFGRLLAGLAAGPIAASLAGPALALDRSGGALDALIAKHAQANGVPAELVHRVIVRESGYNPRAVGRGGALGLMQIKHATARGVGYNGPASGLLDAETNLTYGVRYLAGAYRVANGNPGRAVSYYARGYYYEAKRRGVTSAPVEVSASPVAPSPAPSGIATLFGIGQGTAQTAAAPAAAAPAAAPQAVVAVEAAPRASAYAPVAAPRGVIAVLPPARPAAFGGAAPAPEVEETATVASQPVPVVVERSFN